MRILISICVLSLFSAAEVAESKTLYVIANSNIAVSELSPRDLEDIYLLRQAYWPDGNLIVPVNREASSDLRKFFSDIVLKQAPSALNNYWNQMHFRGKSPPVVQSSDDSVAAFVRKIPGAVGYVADPLGLDGVKIVAKLP